MEPKNNPVGWFEIYVQNLERAGAFYEKTFNVKLQSLNSPVVKMMAFPMRPGASGAPGALVEMPGKESGPSGTIVYFTCDDCAVEAQRAAQSGGRIFKEKFSIGQYGFISLVIDTEENMIGLYSMR